MTITGDFAGCTAALVDGVAWPTSDELRQWLSIESASTELAAMLEESMLVANGTHPQPVRSVRDHRRRHRDTVRTRAVRRPPGDHHVRGAHLPAPQFASGFEGFADIGFARVSSIDPDIESLLERWLGHDFA